MLFSKRSCWNLIGGLAILVGLPASAFGQSQANTGTIEGTVVDASNQVIPKAEVTLTNTGTNFTRVLTTDDQGRFRGLLLPLGTYKVTAKAANFGTLVQEGFDLAVGESIKLTLPSARDSGNASNAAARPASRSPFSSRKPASH